MNENTIKIIKALIDGRAVSIGDIAFYSNIRYSTVFRIINRNDDLFECACDKGHKRSALYVITEKAKQSLIPKKRELTEYYISKDIRIFHQAVALCHPR